MNMLTLKRVDRLVMLSVIGSVLMVWLVLTGFDAVTQFLRQLGSVGKNGYTLNNAIVYVLVTFPRRLYEMFPNAALIGGLLGLGGLASTGELTALRAAGMSRLRIAVSAVGVVTVLIVGVVIMGETVGPWGDQKAQAMQLRMKNNNVGATSSGTWARDGSNFINARGTMLIHRGGIDSVELADVRIFTMTPDGQLTRFEWAKSAQHNGKQWILKDVRDSTLDATGVHTTTLASQPWVSGLNPQVLAQSIILPQYLSMRDLQRNIRYRAANGETPGVYAVAFRRPGQAHVYRHAAGNRLVLPAEGDGQLRHGLRYAAAARQPAADRDTGGSWLAVFPPQRLTLATACHRSSGDIFPIQFNQ